MNPSTSDTSPTHDTAAARALPPRVTIGVPVYNGQRYLAPALDSLLAQTFQDFTIIIGDNASTDATAEIARDYAEKDRRVRYVRRERNLGISRNYNALFAKAESEYFRWQAADDLCAPRLLEACIQVLDADPSAALAYPRIVLVDEDGRAIAEHAEHLHLAQDRPSDRFTTLLENIGMCNTIFGVMRTSVVRRTRLMRSFPGADIPFQAELSLYGKFIEVPEVLFYRRMHGAASNKVPRNQLREMFNPGRGDSIEFHWWRQMRENIHSVLRAPIGAAERTRLLLRLGRWFVGSREHYVSELIEGARHLRRRRRDPPQPPGSASDR